ncbi:MAG TPA: glycosyltransferase family 2 protein [Methylomirabilota bacterium]
MRERLSRILEFGVRPFILRMSVRHLHGPRKIAYAMDELIAVCVVRNGALHVRSFIEHHQALGVKHIVLLDNGSTDQTVELARSFERVTILQTRRPYRKYETVMKRYLVRRFSTGRWNLLVDIDELFDYPFSEVLDVGALLTYLNAHSYTAVVAQMLDLFSDIPLEDLKSAPSDSLKERYRYYDVSNIEKRAYRHGTPANPEIKGHFGGVRKSIFGTDNGLTKTALILLSPELVPFVVFHHHANAAVADFTCVLLHYPFVSSFGEKVREAVQTDRYRVSAAGEYRKYWARLKESSDLCLKQPTARRFEGVNKLLDDGFLVVSTEYRRCVEAHRKTAGPDGCRGL